MTDNIDQSIVNSQRLASVARDVDDAQADISTILYGLDDLLKSKELRLLSVTVDVGNLGVRIEVAP